MTQQSAETLVAYMYPQSTQHAALIVSNNLEIAEGAGFTSETDPQRAAKLMANKYGAFNWDGPYGNGFSKAKYRSSFVRMAEENIAILIEFEFQEEK